MKTIAFFLEEPSIQAMLSSFLPQIISPIMLEQYQVRYVVFEGKQDLQKRLEKRLRGWQLPDTSFIILHDQDSADCKTLKQELVQICQKSGKQPVLVRIACHELESWYLGDLRAVERGMEINGLAKKQRRQKYRNPDQLINAKEEFKKITGYQYQEIAHSREIGKYLSPNGNKSPSFRTFVEGLLRMIAYG